MFKKLLFVFGLILTSISMAFAQVNLNTASEQELQTVSGIGPAKARAIVAYRTEHGSFKSVEELKNVRGIGRGVTYDRIAPQVTVGGTATATRQAVPAVGNRATAPANSNSAGGKAPRMPAPARSGAQ